MSVSRFTSNYGVAPTFWNFRNIFKSIFQTVRRKLFNKYPEMPFIPFNATKRLKEIIKPDWKILEIGSGMSTLWMAQRCHEIKSIEASQDWFVLLSSIIKKKNINNVELIYEWRAEAMTDFSKYEDKYFDLVFVDGGPRAQCCKNALPKVKLGGYIYLDNSDNEDLTEGGREILLNNSKETEFFVDFVSGQVVVNEGMLIKL